MTTEVSATEPESHDAEPGERLYSWAEFRTEGLLWLLNTTALHPRGFALAFEFGDDEPTSDPIGWRIIGDGSEPFVFADVVDGPFASVNELLRRTSDLTPTPPPSEES